MKCLFFIVFIGFVFSQSKKHSDYLETIEGSKLQIQMIYLLGDGDIKDSIKLEVNAVSESARKKIEKAGGEIIIKES